MSALSTGVLSLPAMDKFLVEFYPHAPYDFAITANASRYYTMLGKWREHEYWRALRSGDGIALVKIANRGTVDKPALGIWLAGWKGDIDESALPAKVARMLNLSLNLTPFYELIRSDAMMSQIVSALHGLHIFQTESLYEALIITVIEQQIALAAAQRGEQWLIHWAGERIESNGDTFYLFPRAERISSVSVEDLTPLKITFGRMQRLIDIARLEVHDSFEQLRDLPHEEIYAALTALKGVGHWTAAWTMNRGLGRLVYVGSADVALRAAVNGYFYGQKGRADAALTDAIFARYGDFAGLAAYYTLMKWALDRYPRNSNE